VIPLHKQIYVSNYRGISKRSDIRRLQKHDKLLFLSWKCERDIFGHREKLENIMRKMGGLWASEWACKTIFLSTRYS